LRVPQIDLDCRYPKYHNFSSWSDFTDMLEIAQVLKSLSSGYRIIQQGRRPFLNFICYLAKILNINQLPIYLEAQKTS